MDLVSAILHFIMSHPEILEHLPDDFRLILLPDDDPELSRYNLDLLARHSVVDKPVVFARLLTQTLDFQVHQPQIYVPLSV